MNDEKIRISMDDLMNEAFTPPASSGMNASFGASPSSNPYIQNQYIVPQKSSRVSIIIGILLVLLLIAGGIGCFLVFSGGGNGENSLIPTSLRQPNFKKPIMAILRRDRELAGQIIGLNGFEDAKDKDLYLDRSGNSILNYVRMARSFDESSVPHDFTVAYRNYLTAWEKRGHLLTEHPHIGNFVTQFIDGFIMGFFGNISEAFAKDARYKAWAESVDATEPEILDCMKQVENSAEKYGVDFNQNEFE